MKENKITVFTPTYNRAYILKNLYESLMLQTVQKFEWLIVDDGSTDETADLVATWLKENKISIRYLKQRNGGKQRAHNKGVEECKTELFVCVDSDDYIAECSIESILKTWKNIKNDDKLAGIIALRGVDEKTPIGTAMPEVQKSSLRDLYRKYHFKGDTTLVYRTEILKKYPYWVAEGEKFIGEGYVYQQIDQKYEMYLLPEIIIICNYLEDGYTKNVRRLTKQNPKGYTELKRMTVCNSKTWKERFYHTILYMVGCKLSKEKHPLKRAPYKILAILAFIPAELAWIKFYKNA